MTTKLIIVTGKGGVGKSMLSAAMGYALGRRGIRTAIIEVGDEGVVQGFFGRKQGTYGPQQVSDGLWTMLIDPWQALHEYALTKLHFNALYKVVFGNPLMTGMMQAVPGLAELLILGKVGFEVENRGKDNPHWDCVILDLPATGHGQRILQIPDTVITSMKTGPMVTDAKALRHMLRDRTVTAIVMVTLCEQMPVRETLQFTDEIDHILNRRPEMIVANRMLPVRMNEYEQKIAVAMRRAARRKAVPHLEEALQKSIVLARMRDNQDQALQTLETRIKLPVLQVPMVPVEGMPRVQRLAGYVEDRAMQLME